MDSLTKKCLPNLFLSAIEFSSLVLLVSGCGFVPKGIGGYLRFALSSPHSDARRPTRIYFRPEPAWRTRDRRRNDVDANVRLVLCGRTSGGESAAPRGSVPLDSSGRPYAKPPCACVIHVLYAQLRRSRHILADRTIITRAVVFLTRCSAPNVHLASALR